MRDIFHVKVKSIFQSKYKDHDFYIETSKDESWMLDFIRGCMRMTLDRPRCHIVFTDITQDNIATYRMDIGEKMSYIVTFHRVKLATL